MFFLIVYLKVYLLKILEKSKKLEKDGMYVCMHACSVYGGASARTY